MSGTESGASGYVQLDLGSTLDSVDRAEEVVGTAAREAGLTEDQCHDVGIAVRETMVNAVAHGNQYNARKKVRLRVWSGPGGLAVEIEDEGKGFDLEEVPDPRNETNLMRHSGRGLLMIKAFMDEVSVSRRPDAPGTLVRLVKHRAPAG